MIQEYSIVEGGEWDPKELYMCPVDKRTEARQMLFYDCPWHEDFSWNPPKWLQPIDLNTFRFRLAEQKGA